MIIGEQLRVEIQRNVAAALAEDIGTGDLTAHLIPDSVQARGRVITRENAILCGSAWFDAAFAALQPNALVTWHAADGDRLEAGQPICDIIATARSLLTAERTALNLLCHMSGVATLTRRWADALTGTSAVVRDTRKTLPGLRALQKYAVRCGGGQNHRMALSDAALVKDNHVLAAGGVAEAFAAVRSLAASIPVEIEVDSLDGLREAIDAGADVVLLDNFTPEQMEEAVAIRDEVRREVILEASGGLTLQTARRVGETGVDYIAVGELTHSVTVFDIGLDLRSVS